MKYCCPCFPGCFASDSKMAYFAVRSQVPKSFHLCPRVWVCVWVSARFVFRHTGTHYYVYYSSSFSSATFLPLSLDFVVQKQQRPVQAMRSFLHAVPLSATW